MVSRPLRLYRFVVEVLDEPNCSDIELESQLQDAMWAYFEAVDVNVELEEAHDCVIGVDEMAEA